MNYIGSKKSLLNFIDESINSFIDEDIINNPEKYTFCDLFSGTCSVASHYKEKGFNVIANDLQYYSYVIGRHLIQNDEIQNEDLIDDLNDIKLTEGFIYNNYCSPANRLYFSDYNGKKADSIRQRIQQLYDNEDITEDEYYFLLASLLQSLDRNANTASVYVSFLKKLKKSAQLNFELKPFKQIKSNADNKMYNENSNDLIRKIKGDILYLDPPYNGRQYAQYYHVLETIALYDNPELTGITGQRKIKDKQSKYCSKKQVLDELEDLIKNADFKYIFMSYNDEGLMNLKEIENIMKKYGHYELKTQAYKRYKADNKRDYKKDETLEYLHCLKKDCI